MVVESTPARRMKLFVRAFKMNFRGTVDIVLPVEGVFVAPKRPTRWRITKSLHYESGAIAPMHVSNT
jgi:hypothetical protein